MYNLHDTIAAISTPPGRGGIAIIRLSGPLAFEIISKLFKPSGKQNLKDPKTHTLIHGWILDNANVAVDEVMVAIMKAPHSYTKDDVIEISAHGGLAVAEYILKLCVLNGARMAGPGEFTLRAYVNGRLDLSSAEAVADIIASKTEIAVKSAAANLSGVFSKKIALWRNSLIELLSLLEAAIDHAGEDIVFVQPDTALNNLKLILNDIDKLINTASKGRFVRDGLRVAIIGRPNSGKSSLLNAILQKERSIVTDIPGTTRDIIEETIDLRGLAVVIIDTAGLRKHTLDPIEMIGHERTVSCIKSADLILWVFDASQDTGESEVHIASILNDCKAAEKTIPILNKTDLTQQLSITELKKLLLLDQSIVKVSALNESGLSELEDAIISFSGISGTSFNEPLLTSARHIDALNHSKASIENAIKALSDGESEEIIAFNVREALNYLGEITGETATEEILDNIFSKFCIGK